MMVCRSCGKNYEDGHSFCRECGAPLVPMTDGQTVQDSNGAQGRQPKKTVGVESPSQVVSVGEWILVLLMPLIPCVGWLVWLVMMFVWGFGSGVKPSKKTFARASLIIALVVLVLVILILVIGAAVGVTFSSLMNEAPYQYDYRYHYYY